MIGPNRCFSNNCLLRGRELNFRFLSNITFPLIYQPPIKIAEKGGMITQLGHPLELRVSSDRLSLPGFRLKV